MHLPVIPERCTGHCCERFPLHQLDYFTHASFAAHDVSTIIDGEYIADMVMPVFGPRLEGEPDLWTCRHFDGSNCTAYESRPDLCRTHGVKYRCQQPDCTLPPPAVATLCDHAGID